MNAIRSAGALALALLLVSCGETRDPALENRQGADTATASQASEVYSATGKVTAIANDQVTIAHGPVEGIGWPAMTMSFRAQSPAMVQGVGVGDQVSFAFRQDGGTYVLTSLKKAG